MQSQPTTDNSLEPDKDSQNLYSAMAERAVLGGLLRKDNALEVLAVLLTEEDFFLLPNRSIFHQITFLRKSSKRSDLIAVAEALELAGELNKIGGQNYLNSLLENLPTDNDIQNCAVILRERLVSRTSPAVLFDEDFLLWADFLRKRSRERIRRIKLLAICTDITARVMKDTGVTSVQLIDDAVAELFKLKDSV